MAGLPWRVVAYVFTLLWLVSVNGVYAQTSLPHYVISSDQSEWRDFEVLLTVDPTQRLSINSVLEHQDARITHTSRLHVDQLATYWLGWTVENATNNRQSRLVGFDESFPKQVVLYEANGDGWLERFNGIEVPVAQRQLQTELPIFEIELAPSEQKTFYLKLDVGAKNTTIGTYMVQRANFVNEQRLLLVFHVAVMGALAALFIYNLFLSFALRDNLYLFYSGYVGFFLLFLVGFTGLDLLAGISGSWHHRLFAIAGLGTAFLVLFSRKLLSLDTLLPRFNNLLTGLALAFIVLSLIAVFDINFYQYMIMLTPVTMLILLASAIYAYRSGSILAKYYLFGMSWYLVGMFLLTLLSLGVISYDPIYRHAFVPAALIEVLIFAFALAYRFRLLEQEKTYYQQQLLAQQATERKRLEELVENRTEALRQANQQLTYLSERDALTGLYNRRYLDQLLLKTWQDVKLKGQSLCLAMLDIDDFKSYNDLLGHQAGDRCLQTVAEVMSDCCKQKGYLAARYGGEEFLIVMQTNLDNAQQCLAHVRQRLAQEVAMPHPRTDKALVTISAGIACMDQLDPISIDVEALLSYADQALYQSKNNGKDMVSIYQPY
jgi:two-component system, sensor histidine kinase LadS